MRFIVLRDHFTAPSIVALLIVVSAHAQDKDVQAKDDAPPGAYKASQCLEAPKCPLFDDVYANTPAFRHALSLNLRHGDELVPEWAKDKLPDRRRDDNKAPPPPTTASAMLPLRIDDRSYLIGHMSDPADSRHRIDALYDTQRGFATVHYVNKDGQAALLGDATEILRKVMTDYLNTDSAFSRSLERPDVALPVPVRSQ